MDPPWQLASAAPTRGVALGYKQLPNADIANLPVPALQKNGFIFIWVINARYSYAIDLMEKWGYKLIDGPRPSPRSFSVLADLFSLKFHSVRRYCLGEINGQSPVGQGSRFLSSTRQGNMFGREEGPGSSAIAAWDRL